LKTEVFVEGVRVGMAYIKDARPLQAQWTVGFLVPAGGHFEVKLAGAKAAVHLHAHYSPLSDFVRSERRARGKKVEHGIASAGRYRATIHARAVSSASTILVSLEGKAAGTVTVIERMPGVGFVVQTDAPRDKVDWAVLN
jgi:hypothetical protein